MKRTNRQITDVETHFDLSAQRWKSLYHEFNTVNDIVLLNRKNLSVELLCKYLRAESRILDAGCGAGVLALDIAKKSFHVYGIDISQKMIDICEESFSHSGIDSQKYEFRVGDVVEAKLSPETFDGVIAMGFLEYQNDELEALSSLCNTLRPGGILICTGPNKISISNFFGLGVFLQMLLLKVRGSKRISVNQYSVTKFKKLLSASGFTVTDYTIHGYANFIGIYKLIGFKGELLLSKIFNWISSFLPINRFANDIVVVAKKNGDVLD